MIASPSSEPSSEGETALVTGARSGIGEATSRPLAARGAAIALVCNNGGQERAQQIVDSIRSDGGRAFHADVTLLEKVLDVVGRGRLVPVMHQKYPLQQGHGRRSGRNNRSIWQGHTDRRMMKQEGVA